jgi:hypothetical protein
LKNKIAPAAEQGYASLEIQSCGALCRQLPPPAMPVMPAMPRVPVVVMRMPPIIRMPVMPVIPVCLRAGSRRNEKDSQRQDGQQALYHFDKSQVEELEVEGKQYVLISSEHEMNGKR